jgi:hypothetical protein
MDATIVALGVGLGAAAFAAALVAYAKKKDGSAKENPLERYAKEEIGDIDLINDLRDVGTTRVRMIAGKGGVLQMSAYDKTGTEVASVETSDPRMQEHLAESREFLQGRFDVKEVRGKTSLLPKRIQQRLRRY